VVSGAFAAGTGALLLTRPNLPPGAHAAGLTSAAIGGVSMLVSARSIHRHREIVSAERAAASKRSVAIAPMVTNGTGIAVALRF
jgi:hypothetical protein